MKKYSVSSARAQLASVLDLVDKGVAVAIDRRGTRYLVVAEPVPPKYGKKPAPLFEVDEALLEGGFTWGPSAKGGALELHVGPAKRKKSRA